MGRGASIPTTARFAERFLAYVGMLGGDACWPWLGSSRADYPQVRVPGLGTTSARLWVWAMFRKGPVPKKRQPGLPPREPALLSARPPRARQDGPAPEEVRPAPGLTSVSTRDSVSSADGDRRHAGADLLAARRTPP